MARGARGLSYTTKKKIVKSSPSFQLTDDAVSIFNSKTSLTPHTSRAIGLLASERRNYAFQVKRERSLPRVVRAIKPFTPAAGRVSPRESERV
ncbi:hypothetical protein EVAR_81872_1 [Eumeta japonica]|uniref:Uncharacterized protein n=1 Tax=Eumeta variegata TaxID=151549 RepID=A0A4C1UYV2_EUMVA|nr:hypothetical protein EVAR_81872_1 [Eumeta japonica]